MVRTREGFQGHIACHRSTIEKGAVLLDQVTAGINEACQSRIGGQGHITLS